MISLPSMSRTAPAGEAALEFRPGDELPVSRLKTAWRRVPRLARQIIVAVLGAGVLVVGAAMIVLPGPAVLVLPMGLAVLATEFHWARRLLHSVRARAQRLKQATLTRLRRSRG